MVRELQVQKYIFSYYIEGQFYVYIVPFYKRNPQARSAAGRKPGAEGSDSGIRKSSAIILGSRIIDGKYFSNICVFIGIYACVMIISQSTTVLITRRSMRCVMFTSCTYSFLRLESKYLNCTRSSGEIVQKLNKHV